MLFVASVGLAGACGSQAAAGEGEETSAAPDTALQRMTAEIAPLIEELAALPLRAPLAVATRDREGLEAYLTEELERQAGPGEIEAMVRVYARFGLVPDTIDLEPLLRSLLLEQVVGYYDPRSDTLYVVQGAATEQVEAVLAHEIVHALQDQYMDLDSLIEARSDDNDASVAARSALEGHATFAMLEWQLEILTGQRVDLSEMPNLSTVFGADPLALAGVDMPVLRDAPAVIRESLLFPYLGGVAFLQAYWAATDHRVAPIADLMPESTEQILHPERFAPATRDSPTRVRFTAGPPDGWTEIDSDGLGELEIRIFLEEFLEDRARAESAAFGWDGDRYRLLEGPEGEVLAWLTVWDSMDDASEFESATRRAFTLRYERSGGTADRTVTLERSTYQGRPVVIVVDRPQALPETALGALLEADLDGD